jgi:LuxR family maltose regulon positive regulatory protein
MDLLVQTANSQELVSTKLALPRLGGPRLARRSLLARLHAGLQHKLTLISAGAGFGKTTLAVEWVHSSWEQAAGPAVAWVSLDSGDNDPLRFWRYVFTAVQSLNPEASSLALARLEASQESPFEAALTALINALADHPGRDLLILEDYHFITNPGIHAGVAFLLEHLPQALHVVILTRGDPPLPLARLRARSEINELRALDLRFSLAETQAFLQGAVSHPLAPGTAEHLAARTEGWPAGLRLAGLALQSRPDPQAQVQFLETFTGSHRPLLEYLVADVLAAQPASLQAFLLETSFLNRLTGPLCDAVTGRSDSAAILDELERLNLFLEPLDGAGEWYRFHALFAEAMQHTARQRLGEARLRRIAQAASLWYEAHALQNHTSLSEAVEAALLAQSYPRAAGLIERTVKPRLVGNEYHTLLRWLQNLPEQVLVAHPHLAMTYAQAILFTSDLGSPGLASRLEAPLAMAEGCWAAEGNLPGLGEVLAFRALLAARQGDYRASFTLARQALDRLPETAVSPASDRPSQGEWRAVSLNLVGWEEYHAGRLNAALHALTTARSLFQSVRNIFGLLDATLALGEVYTGRAEARQAARFYRQALAECEAAPISRKDRLRRQGRGLTGLARLAYEQDDLEDAGQDAARALEIAQEIEAEELLVYSTLILARIEGARNNLDPAQARMSALIARLKRPDLLRELQAWQAWLALSAGDLAAAQRWAATWNGSGENVPCLVREREGLVQARVQLASGQAGAALGLLEGWLESAREQGRARSELEIRILSAEALAALGRLPEAHAALARARALADPEGYRRVFLDEGERLGWLIEDCGLLIDGTEEDPQKPIHNHQSIITNPIDPLSQQEQRVFHLLAAGLSNPEIAQEMVISVNTVKTHVKSIYRKLNVDSRQALRRFARRPHLLA